MSDRIFIIGGSVASLVAALTCAQHGRSVTLICNEERAGGSFGGISFGKTRYDLGVRLFELDYENVQRRTLADFKPNEDSHRPFIGEIAKFVRHVCGENTLHDVFPEMWIRGQRIKCPLMTVDLYPLAHALSTQEQALIAHETASLHTNPHTVNENLRDASLAQHGHLLHTLITEAICQKQWHLWEHTMASERRKLWAALFHADTVHDIFSGRATTFKPYRPFTAFKHGATYQFIDKLMAQIRICPLITMQKARSVTAITNEKNNITLTLDEQRIFTLPADKTVMGLAPEALFNATGVAFKPERITASLAWAHVPEDSLDRPPACLTIADLSLNVFRIEYVEKGIFCLEFGAATPTIMDIRLALESTGAIRAGASINLLHQITGPAQPAPTLTNRNNFNTALQQFRDSGFTTPIIGSARQFGWGSLNDHIVDGLYYGTTQC